MLVVTYSPLLVAASMLVAVMAAFTALRLTNRLGALAPAARRPVIAKAAVALGGGIWSMHFVGMLAVRLPVTVRYDALPTLLSALFAILVVGIGFIILHFGTRDWRRIVAAGACMGFGIVGMHYLGMSAVSGNCTATYDPWGIASATVISLGASTFGLWLAYRRRTMFTIAIGAVALGLAISAMHYSAMVFTTFVPVSSTLLVPDPALSRDLLAMLVSLAAFVICGLFLLIAIPVEAAEPASVPSGGGAGTAEEAVRGADSEGARDGSPAAAGACAVDGLEAPIPAEVTPGLVADPARHSASLVYSRALGRDGAAEPPAAVAPSVRVPYERDGAVRFVPASSVAAVRADGHYTWLITGDGELFCPWPISRFEAAVVGGAFIRTHRSYLANLERVNGFRRQGDRAVCLVGAAEETEIPVSRTRVAQVREALGVEGQ